jgi:hypothetical protein
MGSLDKYNTDQDFGFTAVDEMPTAGSPEPPISNSALEQIQEQLNDLSEYIQRFAERFNDNSTARIEDVDGRLREVEELIMPLLMNLMKNPEKEYILWPNRQTQIQKQIDKILAITRKGVHNGPDQTP